MATQSTRTNALLKARRRADGIRSRDHVLKGAPVATAPANRRQFVERPLLEISKRMFELAIAGLRSRIEQSVALRLRQLTE
jgi:hypothetical protein